jgi:beta-ureidopropionase
MSKLRGGLIQMSLKGSTDQTPEEIRKAMIEAHLP